MCIRDRDNTTPSEPSSVVESPEDRARGQTSKPEDVSLQTLMDFIRQCNQLINESSRKQEENNKLINEKLDKQKEENSKLISEKLEKQNEKLDQHKEEMKRQSAEQLAQIRSEIREYLSLIHI